MQSAETLEQHAERSDLDLRLRSWVDAGLLTAEQADAIRRHEAGRRAGAPGTTLRTSRPPRRAHRPSPAEGLGYVGGILALAGTMLLLSRYWAHLSSASQLALSGAATLVLLGAGATLPTRRRSAYGRLRAVLWLAAAATISGFAVVAVRAAAADASTATLMFAGASAAAAESGLLWFGRDRPVQQLGFFAAGEVAVGAAIALLVSPPGWSGVGVAAGGFALLWSGRRRLLPAPVPTEVVGILGVISGGSLIAAQWSGAGLLTLTSSAAVLLALALLPSFALPRSEQLWCGVFGALIAVETLPNAIGYFAAGAALTTGAVTALGGVVLLVAGERELTRLPAVVSALGAVLLLVGAAVTWNQVHGLAPILGIVAGLALIGSGLAWDSARLSLLGALGLLANVLWALAWFFPGRARAPLLAVVAGAAVIGIALLLSRASHRARRSPPGRRRRR